MAIPDYQTGMLPLLEIVKAKSPISVKAAIDLISEEFQLTFEERTALLPSGKQEIIVNRVEWADIWQK